MVSGHFGDAKHVMYRLQNSLSNNTFVTLTQSLTSDLIRVCLYGDEDKENKESLKVTTANLSELRDDGWIDKTVVELALRWFIYTSSNVVIGVRWGFVVYSTWQGQFVYRHMWECEISADLAARTWYLDPSMMSTLLLELVMSSAQDDLCYSTRSNSQSM